MNSKQQNIVAITFATLSIGMFFYCKTNNLLIIILSTAITNCTTTLYNNFRRSNTYQKVKNNILSRYYMLIMIPIILCGLSIFLSLWTQIFQLLFLLLLVANIILQELSKRLIVTDKD